jgi:hypothetical protein
MMPNGFYTPQGKPIVDRRKENRRYLTYFSRVIDRETGHTLGYLVDLTTGGALLVGNLPLKTNTIFQLRIDLPEGIFDKEQLDVKARAVWNQPDSDPEFYRTGLQLVDIQPLDLLILERLLTNFGTTPEGKR